jgi:hypothetical protein
LAQRIRTIHITLQAVGQASTARDSSRDVDQNERRHVCATLLLERGLRRADVAVRLGHTDGGRLVQILYGHPDEERALDRLLTAFSADGHKPAVEVGSARWRPHPYDRLPKDPRVSPWQAERGA